VDRKRYWRLFLRQFSILLAVTAALVAFFYFQHDLPYRPTLDWIEFGAFDAVMIVGASALSARLRLMQEDRRKR
jgi:hypothetical protein